MRVLKLISFVIAFISLASCGIYEKPCEGVTYIDQSLHSENI